MNKQELFAKYGELMIQAEIIQNQIQEIKRQIVEELNKKEELNGNNE